MEDMKIDMAGCAAMLGTMSALAELRPDVEVHGIAAVCENMPSGRAVRPGDVIATMSGKTVEILNTDAEGRVTLADALFYASKLEPDALIDLATLTGSCMVALGDEYAGLMSNNDKLAQRVLDAAAAEGELLWRLPLPTEYKDVNKSKVADLRNIGTAKYGDAIHAGIFLQEFVGKTPWAHLDIAGPAHSEKDVVPHQPYGATGFGVRTLLEYITKL
jgi:leucyl aminopeptidase